jgi:hypothetical protein
MDCGLDLARLVGLGQLLAQSVTAPIVLRFVVMEVQVQILSTATW